MSRVQIEQWLEQFISQHALSFSIVAIIMIVAYLLLIQSLLNRTQSNNFVLRIMQHQKRNGIYPKTEDTLKINIHNRNSWLEKILVVIKLCTSVTIVLYFFVSFYLKRQIIYLSAITGILMICYGVLLCWIPYALQKENALATSSTKSNSVTKWLFICVGVSILLLNIPSI